MGTTSDRNDPALRNVGPDGQQEKYLVLSEDEREKGFVRPLRKSYTHLRCGTVTTMGLDIAETYARNPNFYTGTFCAGGSCRAHYPLDQFTWVEQDGTTGPVLGS